MDSLECQRIAEIVSFRAPVSLNRMPTVLDCVRANQTVITKVVTRVVQKAVEERVVYRDLIKEVEKHVPSTLPADFRVYHDAAAAGVPVPEAGDSARADAAPVRPEDLAVTVAENYAGCRDDRRRFEALQELVREVIKE